MSALRKILVVDDDPVVGKSFDRVLAGKGYAVITASNGEEALHKLSNENYDVVFTDIKMPGMSGLEVAERVKASAGRGGRSVRFPAQTAVAGHDRRQHRESAARKRRGDCCGSNNRSCAYG